MTIERYFLGCPVWGRRDWVGRLLPAGSKPDGYLEKYAAVFNSVEGNTTFYATPSMEVARRWRDQVPSEFRFTFKFPQTVTHQLRLRHTAVKVRAFLAVMEVFEQQLGPLMIQLPPTFGPQGLADLEAFVRRLPAVFRYGLEVRHPALCNGSDAHRRLDRLLTEYAVSRVILDARDLHASPLTDPETVVAKRRKPLLPIPDTPMGRQPVVRFIAPMPADPRQGWSLGPDTPSLEGWAARVADWVDAGLEPYVYMHCPNDCFAPDVARAFHDLVRQRLRIPEMPAWPGESCTRQQSRQGSLF